MNYSHVQVIKFGEFKAVKVVFEGFTYTFMAIRNSVLPGTLRYIKTEKML